MEDVLPFPGEDVRQDRLPQTSNADDVTTASNTERVGDTTQTRLP